MNEIWIILGFVLLLVGIIGSVVPLLPGPPLCYLALLVQQFRDHKPFSLQFLLIWAGIVLLVVLLDYMVPVYGTKKFGGSSYGIWGCTIGFIAAFWMGPWGIILGPFAGAFIGEWLANRDSTQALRAAMGSFLGFLFGTGIKLVTCLVMGYYFVAALSHGA
jgi:uncharacterized protein YqgC (DUF456 family)